MFTIILNTQTSCFTCLQELLKLPMWQRTLQGTPKARARALGSMSLSMQGQRAPSANGAEERKLAHGFLLSAADGIWVRDSVYIFPDSKFCSSDRFFKFWSKPPSYFFSLPLFVFSPSLHLLGTCLFLDSSLSVFFSLQEFSLNYTSFQPLSFLGVSLNTE